MFLKRKIILMSLLLFLIFTICVFSYDNLIVHPNLTKAAAEIYNSQANKKLVTEQIDWMIEGSIAEDTDPRYLNHYYNPANGQGLSGWDELYGVPIKVSGMPAKKWANNQASATGDYSVGAILKNYKEGNLKRTYQGIGHILHLIQDMAVPAHTRNDSHAMGDLYEEWAEQYGQINLEKVDYIKINNLDQAFDELASYSNNNFYSKDTIDFVIQVNYFKNEKDINGELFEYAYKNNYRLYKIKSYKSGDKYFIDFKVHLDYWNMLYPKAVGYSAGAIDYFIKEFEKIDEEKDKQQTLSFWEKMQNEIGGFLNNTVEYAWGDVFLAGRNTVTDAKNNLFEAKDKAVDFSSLAVESGKEIIGNAAQKGVQIAVDAGGKVLSAIEKAGESVNNPLAADELLKIKQSVADEGLVGEENSEAKKEAEAQKENSSSEKTEAKIGAAYVIDGDTITLTTGEKVRYIGIDTPELNGEGAGDDECLAWAARLRNMELLGKGDLKLVKDPAADKDKYGRLLRYVYAGNIFINKQLALEGFAKEFFCRPGWENCPVVADKAKENEIKTAFNSAEQNKRGVFSEICRQETEKKQAVDKEQDSGDKKQNQNQAGSFNGKTANLILGGGAPLPGQSSNQNETEPAESQALPNGEDEDEEEDQSLSSKTGEEEAAPLIAEFNLLDLASGGKNWTASSTVAVDLQISGEEAVNGYFLSMSSTAPEADDEKWTASKPAFFIFPNEDGQKDVYLWLKYGAENNISDMAAASIILDTAAPTSTIIDLAEAYNEIGFSVNWSGTDSGGIAGYDVRYRFEGGEWQDWVSNTASTTELFNIAVEPGTAIYFNVRARDNAGNIGEWRDEVKTKISLPPAEHIVFSEIYADETNQGSEWIELYNQKNEDILIGDWLIDTKFDEDADAVLPSGAVIPANGYYLIGDKSSGKWVPDIADWPMPDYYETITLASADGWARLRDNLGNTVDLIGWGGSALSETKPVDITGLIGGGSIERKASAISTAELMAEGGGHQRLGNGYDSGDNSQDFIARIVPEPQNSFYQTEPRENDAAAPSAVNDLEVQHIYTTNNSIRLFWTSPDKAGAGIGARYDLRYEEKSGECDLQPDWSSAFAVASSSLPQPALTEGEDQAAEISGLAPNTEYCFALMVHNGGAWSNLSNQVSGLTKNIFGFKDMSKIAGDSNGSAKTQTLTAKNSPYYVTNGLLVKENYTLTIEPGVVIKFGGWYTVGSYSFPAHVTINGKLIAKGTKTNPIIFTSIHDDSYSGDSNGDGDASAPQPGNWGGWQFGYAGNVLDNVIMKYGGGGYKGMMGFSNKEGVNQLTNVSFIDNFKNPYFCSYSSSETLLLENIYCSP